MERCKWVDDEIIKLQAMGKIEDGFIREHLVYCDSCSMRVVESRLWIETLKRGLRRLQEASEQRHFAGDV